LRIHTTKKEIKTTKNKIPAIVIYSLEQLIVMNVHDFQDVCPSHGYTYGIIYCNVPKFGVLVHPHIANSVERDLTTF
jgi:hypothetical protein